MSDEFFIGYLATPPATKRFATRAGALVVGGLAMAGIGLALTQRPAGTATWDISTSVTMEGTLQTEPYGMLHQVQGSSTKTTLLVEATKFGLRASAAGLDGHQVRISGTVLSRVDRSMVALDLGEDALVSTSTSGALVKTSTAGAVELRGRVVDSKCFLGAMKPGDGQGHRPCAQLCIEGGIPPVLITDSPLHPYVLLASPDGGPADLEKVLPLIAELRTFRGRIERVGSIEILRWEDEE